VLFVSQEERRASDTVLFSSENNDIANQNVDKSFFIREKNGMTNQLASLARRDYFYLDAFWRVNLGMHIINSFLKRPGYNRSDIYAMVVRLFFGYVNLGYRIDIRPGVRTQRQIPISMTENWC